jgi:WD40 repeat-containing protein SMU1
LNNYVFNFRQKQEGLIPPNSSFDVFSGQVPPTVDDEDIFPTRDDVSIKFGAKSYPECALFFSDGSSLITGSADGFIEVWDVWTGNLKLDLPYQAAEKFMMHDAPVLSMTMTADGDLLASGSQDGQIKIWRVKSGQCLRKFDAAHSDGVTSLMFSSEKSKVLSSSFDGTIRIHGIKSGKMLKEFRGHESFVNSAAFSNSEDTVLSSSSDCSVRLWNVASSECIAIIRPPETSNGLLSPVGSATYITGSPDRILIHQTSNVAYIMTLQGEILQSFTLKESLGNIKACCVSNHGEYIICLTDIGYLACFRASSGKFEQSVQAFTRNAIGMVLHPTRNILAAFSEEGLLKIFKA